MEVVSQACQEMITRPNSGKEKSGRGTRSLLIEAVPGRPVDRVRQERGDDGGQDNGCYEVCDAGEDASIARRRRRRGRDRGEGYWDRVGHGSWWDHF